jgi:hypothetical protein
MMYFITLLAMLMVLVVTGLQVPRWMDDGRLVAWTAPVVGQLMQVSLFIWLAGVTLWLGMARYWWRDGCPACCRALKVDQEGVRTISWTISRGSSCIHTTTGYAPCSCTSSWESVSA